VDLFPTATIVQHRLDNARERFGSTAAGSPSVLDLSCRDIDDQLAELDRVARAFETTLAMSAAALLSEGRPRRSILHHPTFMPSDPRFSLRLSRELSYRSRERRRDDDLYTERSFFRKGYDPIGRLCMRMRSRHAGNMAWRALIGNPGGKGAARGRSE
jgi:hypothetical protein